METLDPAAELPGALRLAPSFPFVGRPRELALLGSLMPRAGGEGRRMALVGGEAGSGKSRLLRHLSRAAADARMLLVATFRDLEADMPAELSSTLVDLRRSEGVVPLRLTGLSTDEIAELVEQAAGGDLGPDLPPLATAFHQLTEGNAFLVI